MYSSKSSGRHSQICAQGKGTFRQHTSPSGPPIFQLGQHKRSVPRNKAALRSHFEIMAMGKLRVRVRDAAMTCLTSSFPPPTSIRPASAASPSVRLRLPAPGPRSARRGRREDDTGGVTRRSRAEKAVGWGKILRSR